MSGVEDVLDDDDVAALDRLRRVLEDLPYAALRCLRSVRRLLEEVESERDLRRSHEIGEEGKRALEDADEDEVLALVIGRDAAPELRDHRGDLLGGEEDFAHVVAGRAGVIRAIGWSIVASRPR